MAITDPVDDALPVVREARRKAEQLATAMEAVGLWDLNWAATQRNAELRICSCPCWRRGHHAICAGLASLTVDINGVPAEVCLPCALAIAPWWVRPGFVGERWAARPICSRPLTFGEHVVRCAHYPGHYIRVELPRPAMGEVWGLPGRRWRSLTRWARASPRAARDRAGQGADVIAAALQLAARRGDPPWGSPASSSPGSGGQGGHGRPRLSAASCRAWRFESTRPTHAQGAFV